MKTSHFNYHLPPDRIAQHPPATRTASRLLAVNDDLRAMRFRDIGELLRPGDLLIGNDTRVLPARLQTRKPSGGRVEVLLERITGAHQALVQLRANKPIRIPQQLSVGDAELTVADRREGFFVVKSEADIAALFHANGEVPLPPYIDRAAAGEDGERYQTVYANADGAVAAPTAGLHFDHALLTALRDAGVGWATITLHIGAGTFKPVRDEDATAHRMHSEWSAVNAEVCARVNRARAGGGRVIAVGTTVVRALESAAAGGALQPFAGDTDLFILPGYNFRAVDALITNFHLPRSTLLMLVCAFAGYDKVMRAYRFAVENNFRFYSYGDAMFVARCK